MSITPSQTVGPFFRIGLIHEEWTRLAPDAADAIVVRGRVLDRANEPVRDAMLEVWQPDSGRFGRIETDPQTGAFEFRALRPHALQTEGRAQAPHLALGVFARGLLKRLYTRIYLPDDPANASDPVLSLVPEERRKSLLAQTTDVANAYRFDIRLSGADETVFFDC